MKKSELFMKTTAVQILAEMHTDIEALGTIRTAGSCAPVRLAAFKAATKVERSGTLLAVAATVAAPASTERQISKGHRQIWTSLRKFQCVSWV